MPVWVQKVFLVLEMIKFQHTIFALPFALTGMLLAAHGWPSAWVIFWIVASCVFARTAAMCFNRWADAEIDSHNPRTAVRAIPMGQLKKRTVLLLALASALLFMGSACMLNQLAALLSPVALIVLLGYSYCKRITSWSHFVLGLALGIAPVGAWIAVRGDIGIVAVLLCFGVISWTAGFDLIYACQDVEADREQRLFSIPSRYGVGTALWLARVLHLLFVCGLIGVGILAGLHLPYWCGVAVVSALLVAEHSIVKPRDLKRIGMAFFTINSWVGVAIFVFTAVDLAMYR